MNTTQTAISATPSSVAEIGTITVCVMSYKTANKFKRDYVRKGGTFLRFKKCSANHYSCSFDCKPGDMFDARGSVYQNGATKWDAASLQSWAKFLVCDDGSLAAFNYDDEVIPSPHWISATR